MRKENHTQSVDSLVLLQHLDALSVDNVDSSRKSERTAIGAAHTSLQIVDLALLLLRLLQQLTEGSECCSCMVIDNGLDLVNLWNVLTFPLHDQLRSLGMIRQIYLCHTSAEGS